MTRLQDLYDDRGQSPWLDNLRRDWLEDGQLAELRRPRACGASRRTRPSSPRPSSGQDDLRRPVPLAHEGPHGRGRLLGDGDHRHPQRARHAAAGLRRERRRGRLRLARGVPGPGPRHRGHASRRPAISTSASTSPTCSSRSRPPREGVPAIETHDRRGPQHQRHADLRPRPLRRGDGGLPARARGAGGRRPAPTSCPTVASVASFFVSRVDTEVDRRLETLAGGDDGRRRRARPAGHGRGGPGPGGLPALPPHLHRRRAGRRCAAKGARVQRPLWASTSTKNPGYPDLLYVDTLIGPGHGQHHARRRRSRAFEDHGTLHRTVDADPDAAGAALARLARGRHRHGRRGADARGRGRALLRQVVRRAAAVAHRQGRYLLSRPRNFLATERSAHEDRHDRTGQDGRQHDRAPAQGRARGGGLRPERRRAEGGGGQGRRAGDHAWPSWPAKLDAAAGGLGDAARRPRRRTPPSRSWPGCSPRATSSSTAATPTTRSGRPWPTSSPSTGVGFVDAGTSGGVWGLTEGYCLMVGRHQGGGGGRRAGAADPGARGRLRPRGPGRRRALRQDGAQRRSSTGSCRPTPRASRSWARPTSSTSTCTRSPPSGATARWCAAGCSTWPSGRCGPSAGFDEIKGVVVDSGEGRWTAQEAIDRGVPAPVIATSLFTRFASQEPGLAPAQDARRAAQPVRRPRRDARVGRAGPGDRDPDALSASPAHTGRRRPPRLQRRGGARPSRRARARASRSCSPAARRHATCYEVLATGRRASTGPSSTSTSATSASCRPTTTTPTSA